MLLTEQNICFYLVDKGYMPATQLVDGEFRVDVFDSRNRNFIVNRDFDNAYFIKHVKVLDYEKTTTLRTEATCYWLAYNDENYAALKQYLPTYHDFDYNNHILVLGYEKQKVNLHDFYYRQGHLHPAIPKRLSRILASYHKEVSANLSAGESGKLFKKEKPWVFSLGSPEKYARMLGERKAESQVLQLVSENKRFKELIAAQEDLWQFTCLMHNDLKFTNFLINDRYDGDNELDISIIDWELAGLGDPCWDVAAVFQSFLGFWIGYELNKNMPGDFSLGNIQPSIREFWHDYSAAMEYSPEEEKTQLTKSIIFCGLKLIHTCFETTPGAESLQPYGAKLLQLSFNILNSPLIAQQQVLGII